MVFITVFADIAVAISRKKLSWNKEDQNTQFRDFPNWEKGQPADSIAGTTKWMIIVENFKNINFIYVEHVTVRVEQAIDDFSTQLQILMELLRSEDSSEDLVRYLTFRLDFNESEIKGNRPWNGGPSFLASA
jgi:hypothetical protein